MIRRPTPDLLQAVEASEWERMTTAIGRVMKLRQE
jgi:hypothetical protein